MEMKDIYKQIINDLYQEIKDTQDEINNKKRDINTLKWHKMFLLHQVEKIKNGDTND